MFDNRERLRNMLADPRIGGIALNLEFGYVHGAPTGRDELPTDVQILERPNLKGGICFPSGDWQSVEPEALEQYPVVLDHWLPQMRYRSMRPDGAIDETASGIGLPAERLINYKTVQDLGNKKDEAAAKVLAPIGADLATLSVSDFAAHRESWLDTWGDEPVIFKPRNGSKGKGIEIFDSVVDFEAALASGKLPANGIVQPFMDLRAPIPELKPLNEAFVDQLRTVNSGADRVRELRLHLFVSTQRDIRTVEVRPTLKVSARGERIMKNWEYVPLDPEAFETRHQHLVGMARSIGHQTAQVADVPHLYGVADVSIGTHTQLQSAQIFVGDLNLRGPRLPDFGPGIVTPAQKAFVRMHKTMARLSLEASS